MDKRRKAKAGKVSINVGTHEAISTPSAPIYPRANDTVSRDFQITEPNKGGRPKGKRKPPEMPLDELLPLLAEASRVKRGELAKWHRRNRRKLQQMKYDRLRHLLKTYRQHQFIE